MTTLTAQGWKHWELEPAPEGALVKFWDEREKLVWVGTSYDVQMVSTAYLWWALTGIAKEEMGK